MFFKTDGKNGENGSGHMCPKYAQRMSKTRLCCSAVRLGRGCPKWLWCSAVRLGRGCPKWLWCSAVRLGRGVQNGFVVAPSVSDGRPEPLSQSENTTPEPFRTRTLQRLGVECPESTRRCPKCGRRVSDLSVSDGGVTRNCGKRAGVQNVAVTGCMGRKAKKENYERNGNYGNGILLFRWPVS